MNKSKPTHILRPPWFKFLQNITWKKNIYGANPCARTLICVLHLLSKLFSLYYMKHNMFLFTPTSFSPTCLPVFLWGVPSFFPLWVAAVPPMLSGVTVPFAPLHNRRRTGDVQLHLPPLHRSSATSCFPVFVDLSLHHYASDRSSVVGLERADPHHPVLQALQIVFPFLCFARLVWTWSQWNDTLLSLVVLEKNYGSNDHIYMHNTRSDRSLVQ